MFQQKKHVKAFDLLDKKEVEDYEGVLNDPLCTIISDRTIKHTTREYQDGQIAESTEQVYLVVTWEEKTLL